jgi:hypothetical protein
MSILARTLKFVRLENDRPRCTRNGDLGSSGSVRPAGACFLNLSKPDTCKGRVGSELARGGSPGVTWI